MDGARRVRMSKLISRVLRHEPELAGLTLDPEGWAPVDDLLDGLAQLGRHLDRDELLEVVTQTPRGDHERKKDRFELSADGALIRARYGHSVAVDPGYPPSAPPPLLYHGTPETNVAAIRAEGISPMDRQLVHLSEDVPSARAVGARRGRPVVLVVDAAGMSADGAVFHRLPGGVWLTGAVPPERIVDVLP